MPSSASSRNSRRLTMDFETPSRRADGDTPPASATSTNVCRSSRSKGIVPLFATELGALRGYCLAWRNDTLKSVGAKEKVVANILVLNSSVLGNGSVSKILAEEAIHRLLEANPGATVEERDLGTAPIPHLVTANMAGVRGVPATKAELAARALSDELIADH